MKILLFVSGLAFLVLAYYIQTIIIHDKALDIVFGFTVIATFFSGLKSSFQLEIQRKKLKSISDNKSQEYEICSLEMTKLFLQTIALYATAIITGTLFVISYYSIKLDDDPLALSADILISGIIGSTFITMFNSWLFTSYINKFKKHNNKVLKKGSKSTSVDEGNWRKSIHLRIGFLF